MCGGRRRKEARGNGEERPKERKCESGQRADLAACHHLSTDERLLTGPLELSRLAGVETGGRGVDGERLGRDGGGERNGGGGKGELHLRVAAITDSYSVEDITSEIEAKDRRERKSMGGNLLIDGCRGWTRAPKKRFPRTGFARSIRTMRTSNARRDVSDVGKVWFRAQAGRKGDERRSTVSLETVRSEHDDASRRPAEVGSAAGTPACAVRVIATRSVCAYLVCEREESGWL